MADKKRALSPPLPPDPTQPRPARSKVQAEPLEKSSPNSSNQLPRFVPGEPPASLFTTMRIAQSLSEEQPPFQESVFRAVEQPRLWSENASDDRDFLGMIWKLGLAAHHQQQQHEQQASDVAPAPSIHQSPDLFTKPPLPVAAQSQSPMQRPISPQQYIPSGSQDNRGGRSGPGYSISSHGTSPLGESVASSRDSEKSLKGDGRDEHDGRTPRARVDSGQRRDPTWDSRMKDSNMPRRPTNTSSEGATPASSTRQSDITKSETRHGPMANENDRPLEAPLSREETLIEKSWGPLFENNEPTARLGQFLRGIALYIVKVYKPVNSLVVTPGKMLQFFADTRVDSEICSWQEIFGGRITFNSISTMYRKLQCQHHLVQHTTQEAPIVPGLTPDGFECFMICLIQARPNEAYARLAKTVMEMPISNADDNADRFPKELPRSLFPTTGNAQAELRLSESLRHEPDIFHNIQGLSKMPPPPPPPPPAATGPSSKCDQRPTLQARNPSRIDDDELDAHFSAIRERTRNPYSGIGEGLGRSYEREQFQAEASRSRAQDARPADRRQRARSNTDMFTPPLNRHNSSASASTPVNVPHGNQQRMSTTGMLPSQGGVPTTSTTTRGRRQSPPMAWNNRRSQQFEPRSMPDQQFGSRLHASVTTPMPTAYDDHSRGRYPSQSRVEQPVGGSSDFSTEDRSNTGRSRPVPIRNAPSRRNYDTYDDGGRTNTATPRDSLPTRRPSLSIPKEKRRRSMYATPQVGFDLGQGGTSGYGSFDSRDATGTSKLYGGQQHYGSLPRR